MSEFNFDTYCGIYCGACSIMMAHTTGQKDPFASYWTKETVKAHLQSQGIKYDESEPLEFKCRGCKSDTVFINCRHCKIRSCARERKVEHCALDCTDFPCQIWSGNQVASEALIEKVPHMKAIRRNLQAIKENGISQWLAGQEKQWQCPDCQTPFSWYTANCSKCGKDLEKIKDFNNL